MKEEPKRPKLMYDIERCPGDPKAELCRKCLRKTSEVPEGRVVSIGPPAVVNNECHKFRGDACGKSV